MLYGRRCGVTLVHKVIKDGCSVLDLRVGAIPNELVGKEVSE